MNREGFENLNESRFEQSQRKSKNGGLLKVALVILVLAGAGAWALFEVEQSEELYYDYEETVLPEILDEEAIVTEEDKPVELEDKLEVEIAEREEGTVDFFYERALKKEKEKDYEGAVEDYTRTIELAKRRSAEMWNSLNNRGIIKAKKLKDYKGAIKDFNKIIEIETNRSDGEVNATRLEAGYTNRAYVKKMMGNKEGACDDLYEALSLGVESSVDFIEKKIDENCL